MASYILLSDTITELELGKKEYKLSNCYSLLITVY
jgi:hypothetical protein